jgi:hypothetical protein
VSELPADGQSAQFTIVLQRFGPSCNDECTNTRLSQQRTIRSKGLLSCVVPQILVALVTKVASQQHLNVRRCPMRFRAHISTLHKFLLLAGSIWITHIRGLMLHP